MKTIKSILIAATLICATAVSAQEAQAPKHEFKVAIGDSVMIKRECQKYCTGETPSVWVWDKVHTVRQLGTKRFADGVLLMNIYSWMCEDCLIPVNGNAEEKAAQAKKEQAGQKKAYEQAVKEGKNPNAAAEQAKKAEEAKKAEPAKPAEPAKEEEAKAEESQPAAPVVPADTVKHEAAKGDSIHSQQNFKHNYHRFTIGVRGGVSSQLHKAVAGSDAKWGIGGDALLDLQYAHYWAKDGRTVDLGLIVGLSVGYAQGSFAGNVNNSFRRGDLDYTVVSPKIKEVDHQVQLEIPLMFSLIHDCGFFFNVGPRFMLPVYTPFKQTIDQANTHISAYNDLTGVTFIDHPVTGKYNGEASTEGNNLQMKINIMLTAELGYEWLLKSGNSLGLGVYADYCVYNSRPVLNASKYASLVDIANPPSNAGSGSVAKLDVHSATDTYAGRVGFFDAGIKLAYHFNWPKKKAVLREDKLF